jgi:hypothetical protein
MPELPETHYDENCLHCVLSPLVELFCKEHPEKDAEQCVRELACLIGEVIGSGVHRSQAPENEAIELVSRLAAIATGQIVHSATLLLYRLRTHPERKPS